MTAPSTHFIPRAYPPRVSARRTTKDPATLYPVHTKLTGAEVDAIDAYVDALNAKGGMTRASRELVLAQWLRRSQVSIPLPVPLRYRFRPLSHSPRLCRPPHPC